MIGPYTVAQLLAGSIQVLLKQKLARNATPSKLLYIIYGHFDDTYKECWDILRSEFNSEIALVSIEQLSDTKKNLYPSGRHTVIHYRNTAQIPVLCFDNGNFEGYGTSLGKIERIGNQVTDEIASCLFEWIIQNALVSSDNQKNIIANFLQNKHNKNCLHVLQILFDTVKPHLENVAAYLNALYYTPELTQEMWGEQLHLLGLFRDSHLFETASASSRSILDNSTLSQIGYWQRETREHIKTSSLNQEVRATLLSVLADSTRLTQARQKLEFSEIRALITRPRRNAEQIALDLIRLDLESVLRNKASDDELQNLAQNILEFYRGNIQSGMMVSLSGMELQQEDIQQFITYLGQKTVTAIKKALAQQIPLITTNLFLGILQCLLVWKDEQDIKTSQATSQVISSKVSRSSKIEKLRVMGIQLFPHSSQENWKELILKVDLQIREKWEELILDNEIGEMKSKQKDVKGLSRKKKKNADRDRKLSSVIISQNEGSERLNEDFPEDAQAEDPLFEQINDIENSESNPILLDIDVLIETSARGEGKFYSASFHLEYDPVETLMLQSLIATVPTEITNSGNQSQLNDIELTPFPKLESVDDSCSLAWACLSEATLSTDLRSIGLAIMKKSAIIQGVAPSTQQLMLPGIRNLYVSFAELTKDMRENSQGFGYFSTFLFSNLPSFLTAYMNLMLEARNTEQDEFDSSYGTWISQLFTLNLQEVKRTHFTHIVTPFHPLQLRWRQTYEQLLASHIETACQQPQLLESDFINELVNLRPVGIPRVLTTREGQRSKLSSGSNLFTDPNSHTSTEGSNLSYPGASSKTDLFTGYSTVLQGLQKLPAELTRKIEQFFRIYPSALDRAHISVISPVNIEIEGSLSRIFEDLQQKYLNAGFFVQLFSPDSVETVSISAIKKPRRRYDENQGELRVRTRHHLFPRTEFVTLRQDLLKTSNGRKFLFADRTEPTQHMFILLDHLGVEMQTYEIPLEARKSIREYVDQIEQHAKSRSLRTSLEVMQEVETLLVEQRLDPLTILLHQGQEVFEEIYQLWTRSLVDNHDAYSLLYYTLTARSQGHPDSIYRYVCKLSQSNAEELGTASLIKTLHKHGIWVAIVDRAITREFFRTSQSDEKNLILIDFHKGIGPQREYNLTISSTWTERVRENVRIALQQILQDTNLEYQYFDRTSLASSIMRQLQDISGGLALQLAATDANTKGLLGLLVTALEASGRIESTSNAISTPYEAGDSLTAVIPLDDHNDWFEREEVRTDLLVIRFEMKNAISELHLYFALIECKFDESIQRASKGFDQLEETAKRLRKRFVNDAPDYAFRLRDLAEAIRSLAKTYRSGLPDHYVELLRTSDKQIHLHVNEGEISQYLYFYQIEDRLAEVKDMCDQNKYRLLTDSSDTLAATNIKSLGEKTCYYRSSRVLGQTFDRLIRWISKDDV